MHQIKDKDTFFGLGYRGNFNNEESESEDEFDALVRKMINRKNKNEFEDEEAI